MSRRRCAPSHGVDSCTLGFAVFVMFASLGALHAEGWPQWRGAHRDGIWAETNLLEAFPPDGLKILWRAPVGTGFSSPCIVQGKVYVTDSEVTRSVMREKVHCLDAAKGKLIWT